MKIEEVCRNISDYIAIELNLDEEKKSVINYGIFAFIHMIICIVLVAFFGAIFNVFLEALIISFTTSILRKTSGGVHASSPERCAVIGTISTILMALIAKRISVKCDLNLLIGISVFVYAYYIIYKLAPVDSPSKPIKNPKKKIKLKKKSIIITTIYLGIVIINISAYLLTGKYVFLTYSMCIYMGLIWQGFSLTEKGHLILGKLDNI